MLQRLLLVVVVALGLPGLAHAQAPARAQVDRQIATGVAEGARPVDAARQVLLRTAFAALAGSRDSLPRVTEAERAYLNACVACATLEQCDQDRVRILLQLPADGPIPCAPKGARAAAPTRKPEPEPAALGHIRPSDPKAVALLERGVALVREKKYQEAIPVLEAAAARDPLLAEAQLQLGGCYARTGDSEKGAWHYEEFVHLAPRHESAPQATTLLQEYFRAKPQAKPRYPLPALAPSP